LALCTLAVRLHREETRCTEPWRARGARSRHGRDRLTQRVALHLPQIGVQSAIDLVVCTSILRQGGPVSSSVDCASSFARSRCPRPSHDAMSLGSSGSMAINPGFNPWSSGRHGTPYSPGRGRFGLRLRRWSSRLCGAGIPRGISLAPLGGLALASHPGSDPASAPYGGGNPRVAVRPAARVARG
jgi:hypothetical protein